MGPSLSSINALGAAAGRAAVALGSTAGRGGYAATSSNARRLAHNHAASTFSSVPTTMTTTPTSHCRPYATFKRAMKPKPKPNPTSAQVSVSVPLASDNQSPNSLNPAHEKTNPSRLPRDDEILRHKHFRIYLRTESPVVVAPDDDHDGAQEHQGGGASGLSPPLETRDVLDRLDRKTHYLQLVVLPQPNWKLKPYPICRVVDKAAERALEKKLAKEKKEKKVVSKTLELNWAIDRHDLGHKLKRLDTFLRSGFKVEILLAPRRRGKKSAEEEEAEEVLRRIEEVAEQAGAFEAKKREGQVLKTLRIWFQGHKPGKKAKENEKEAQDAAGESEGKVEPVVVVEEGEPAVAAESEAKV